MNTNYYSRVIIAVVAALFITSMPLAAYDKAENAKVVQVSGKIAQIDVKLGKLQLELDASKDRKDPTRYNINKNDTRVVDPQDKKFLKLEDLRVGQHVKIEFNYIQGALETEPVAQKIIANPLSEAAAREASLEGSTSTVTTTTTSTTTK